MAYDYEQSLGYGFLPGSRLTLLFRIPPVANCFAFNFESGNGTIEFHFNPRFADSQIVRNTNVKGKWDVEERSGPFPFEKGLPYSITFQCNAAHFMTTISRVSGDRSITTVSYNHRLPVEPITNFTGWGDVKVISIAYTPAIPGDPRCLQFTTDPSCQSSLKYVHPLINGFLPGSQLKVEIKIPQDSDHFYFNFEGEGGIIPLHVTPRFAAGLVVRNTLVKGQWGKEERAEVFPFRKGLSYSLLFQCTESHLTVGVRSDTGNPTINFNYKHRVAAELINIFSVVGEVEVISVA